jgi:hypothetical protein
MDQSKNYHASHTGSHILGEMAVANAEFARAFAEAKDAAKCLRKCTKVTLEIEIDPTSDTGGLTLRATVGSKIPKLPAQAVQFQEGAAGALMTQQDFLMAPLVAAPSRTASGRLPAVGAKAPAPLAAAPKPAPLVDGPSASASPTINRPLSKDAGAGKDD